MVLGTAQLVGCAPEPAPAPSPTPAFASEEEAFAAAEEVYRAYNDAANARRTGSPDADPQRFLTGIALEGDIGAQDLLTAQGLTASGIATIDSIRGANSELSTNVATVTMIACIDVSTVVVLDSAGNNVTPPERGETVVQQVLLVGDADTLLIADASTADDTPC
ncbi:hypothetical protein [Microbacterium phyllosphaerae]|uniref:hypothetical protein n=1 Tax=Microbacterium phyllosphaerae TaxID=124798 RepID=UPI00216A1285|nr:hypothetical protein [Microbacterium phyllosphaerae]MCS3443651.1 hypothetical protein [Microbacterium phyllosphaerae]